MTGKANARAARYGRLGRGARNTAGVSALSETAVRPSRTTAARVLIALVAVVLIGWFSVLARNHALGTSASTRIVTEPGMGAAQWERAMDDLERAELLDPSPEWSLVRAQYLLLRDDGAALRVADDVLRREPDNLAAWWVVLRATRDSDPARWREAVAQIRRLNPTPATTR